MIHENNITRAIIESYMKEWCDCVDVDFIGDAINRASLFLSSRVWSSHCLVKFRSVRDGT